MAINRIVGPGVLELAPFPVCHIGKNSVQVPKYEDRISILLFTERSSDMKAEEIQTLQTPFWLKHLFFYNSRIEGILSGVSDLNPDPCCFGVLSSVISPRSCHSAIYGSLQQASVESLARHKISRRAVRLTFTRTSMLSSLIHLKSVLYPGDSLFTAVLIRTRARGLAYFNT